MPSISQKAQLNFQMSDLLVRLSDIVAVKLSAGLHFMTCAMILLHWGERGSLSPKSPPPIFYLCWILFVHIFDECLLSSRSAVLNPRSTAIRRQGDNNGCLLPSTFARTVPIMTRSLWHSVSWHKPPATIARAGRHQGGCWDTLQWFTYYNWLCQTHTLAVVFSHTHTSWISCCQEQRRVQASWVCTRCMRQKEGNEKKGKRDSECVLFHRQLRKTHRCLNLPSSHQHKGAITAR